MVHVNENGRDFTTFKNFSRSKSFLLRQDSHQYCSFHLSEFEQSKTLQLLNVSKYPLLPFVMHTRKEKTLLFV